jgi:hypothetical protein
VALCRGKDLMAKIAKGDRDFTVYSPSGIAKYYGSSHTESFTGYTSIQDSHIMTPGN